MLAEKHAPAQTCKASNAVDGRAYASSRRPGKSPSPHTPSWAVRDRTFASCPRFSGLRGSDNSCFVSGAHRAVDLLVRVHSLLGGIDLFGQPCDLALKIRHGLGIAVD